jgi:hypothetical protein
MSIEDELTAIKSIIKSGSKVPDERFHDVLERLYLFSVQINGRIADLEDKRAEIVKYANDLNDRLSFVEETLDIDVPYPKVSFEVAFAAMKQGKTIKHANWDPQVNLKNLNYNASWLLHDMMSDEWIILD